jgi:2-(1,2-epoxy-1,2-dihydrophenyl)acetyl-CoA isomerase
MPTFENLLYQNAESTAIISLNRPERFHALSRGLLQDILAAMETAEADQNIRTIILTATGVKAFCSGADLKDAFGNTEPLRPSQNLDRYYHPAIKKIREIQKPIICALNGLAAGAGASFALACDYILAADTASFSVLFVKIGLVPDCGINYMLPRTIGIHKAFELFSTGKSVSAQEAVQWGLFNEIVATDNLMERAMQLANMYNNMPTKTIGLIKNLLNQSASSSFEQILDLEAGYQDIAIATHDASEGISAFLEKREPKFKGK